MNTIIFYLFIILLFFIINNIFILIFIIILLLLIIILSRNFLTEIEWTQFMNKAVSSFLFYDKLHVI